MAFQKGQPAWNKAPEPLKFSTLIVRIEGMGEDSVDYSCKTDVNSKVYKHIIPNSSRFPFDRLKPEHYYALISVKIDTTWLWYIGFPLSDNVDLTLVDETLTTTIRGKDFTLSYE